MIIEKPLVDVSICIPFAEDFPHIYFTLNNIVSVLVASKLTHEIIVCANNSSNQMIEDTRKLITAKDFVNNHKAQLLISDIPANGPAANTAALNAKGKYLCFTDSHVIVHPNIFTECIKVIDQYEDAGLVHSPITWTGVPHDSKFEFGNGRCFQYSRLAPNGLGQTGRCGRSSRIGARPQRPGTYRARSGWVYRAPSGEAGAARGNRR